MWIWIILLICWGGSSLGVFGCGDAIPPAIPLCSTDTDCKTGQRCVGQTCVGQPTASNQEGGEGKGEQHTERSDGGPDKVAEPASDRASEPVPEEHLKPEPVSELSDTGETGRPEEAMSPDQPGERPPELPTEVVPEPECVSGSQRVCYDGDPATLQKGLCRRGQQTCVNARWGLCVGQILPQQEVCGDLLDNNCDGVPDEGCPCAYSGNLVGVCQFAVRDAKGDCVAPSGHNILDTCGDGLDNDCDGSIDEECECKPGTQQACGSSIGECQQGTQTCNKEGLWGKCQGEIPGTVEVCDGKDNDCNGMVDEECPCQYLGSSNGVCATAKRDKQGRCLPPQDYQITESCKDNLDNNCNGVINEGCPCDFKDLSKGVCKGLLRDATGTCPQPSTYQATEICGDGLDNNCNGVIDEGCPCDYQKIHLGVCKDGIREPGGACRPPDDYAGTQELCNDNKDNNCNGQVNETCPCKDGETQPCGSDVGECKKGQQTCSAGNWGSCVGESKGTTEVCDGKDNDCNGAIDENCPCLYRDKKDGVCNTAQRSTMGVCMQPVGYNDTEVCGDGLDNNCDGAIDEGCPCLFQNKNVGVCASATVDNKGVCVAPAFRAQEICGDSKDNNCDGAVDEGCSCLFQNKNAGVCKTAIRNQLGICMPPGGYATAEICDGKDNDCDGNVDNLPVTAICFGSTKCTVPDKAKDKTIEVCAYGALVCNQTGGGSKCQVSSSSNAACNGNTSAIRCDKKNPCPKNCPKVGGKDPKCMGGYCVY